MYPSFWRVIAAPSPENPAPMINTPTWCGAGGFAFMWQLFLCLLIRVS